MAFYRLEQCRKEQLRRKQSKQRKRELFNSLQENDDVEEQGLNETINYVNKSQEAIFIIHRYEGIIKTPNKKAVGYIGKQGELLKKFKDHVGQSRSTIYFEISLYKFLKKYHLFKKSTQQSSYFKNNFKASKVACKENPNFFYR